MKENFIGRVYVSSPRAEPRLFEEIVIRTVWLMTCALPDGSGVGETIGKFRSSSSPSLFLSASDVLLSSNRVAAPAPSLFCAP